MGIRQVGRIHVSRLIAWSPFSATTVSWNLIKHVIEHTHIHTRVRSHAHTHTHTHTHTHRRDKTTGDPWTRNSEGLPNHWYHFGSGPPGHSGPLGIVHTHRGTHRHTYTQTSYYYKTTTNNNTQTHIKREHRLGVLIYTFACACVRLCID